MIATEGGDPRVRALVDIGSVPYDLPQSAL